MIKVVVPATSANLGPGFDVLGLALNLYNTYYFEEIEEGLSIQGCEEEFRNENNLIYTSMMATFKKLGYIPKGIGIKVESDIPVSRGLGSSAACIVGGVMGASYLAGIPLSKEGVFQIATEIEGHPDNVAPAIFGGLVISIMDQGKIYYEKINFPRDIKHIAMIPEFHLSTREAREVLPETIDHKDGVYNTSRIALLIAALCNNKKELIKIGLQDTLHQQYRAKLIPRYDDIVNKCQELSSIGVHLSGAGPTIMALAEENQESFSFDIQKYLDTLENKWAVLELKADSQGVKVIEGI